MSPRSSSILVPLVAPNPPLSEYSYGYDCKGAIPPAVSLSQPLAGATATANRGAMEVDPADILLCDLGSKALSAQDLENALRLWSRPAVLVASRNELECLPPNVPATIVFLDLSWNR